jgi:tetratricopeptide (TPR) repeat protein
LATADAAKDTYDNDKILANIALSYAEMGDPKAAHETAKRISNESVALKVGTLADIVVALIEAQKPNAVQPVLADAVRLSKEIRQSDNTSMFPLAAIVRAQAFAGDFQSARQTHAAIKADSGEGKAYERVALSGIAEAQARSGDIEGAIKTAESLGSTNPFFLGPDILYARAYIKIASAAASKGNFDDALEYAEVIPLPEQTVMALAEIAKFQALAGKRVEAKATYQKALRIANTVFDHWAKDLALRFVAISQAKVGDIGAALETANSIQSIDINRATALAEIAFAQALAKDTTAARKTFQEALKAAQNETIDLPEHYEYIALIRARTGNADAALAWASQLEPARTRAYALLGVAKGLLAPSSEAIPEDKADADHPASPARKGPREGSLADRGPSMNEHKTRAETIPPSPHSLVTPQPGAPIRNTDQDTEERIKKLLHDPIYGELNRYIYRTLKGQRMPAEIERQIRETDITARTTGTSPARMLELMKQAEEALGQQR